MYLLHVGVIRQKLEPRTVWHISVSQEGARGGNKKLLSVFQYFYLQSKGLGEVEANLKDEMVPTQLLDEQRVVQALR